MSEQMRNARKQMEVGATPDRFTSERAWPGCAGRLRLALLSTLKAASLPCLQENEDLSILMSGLRGSNMNEQDFASDGVVMNVVEDSEDFGDSLPLTCARSGAPAHCARTPRTPPRPCVVPRLNASSSSISRNH